VFFVQKRPAPAPLAVSAGFAWDVPIGYSAKKDGSDRCGKRIELLGLVL
jgi:hypothetical protein